MMYSCVTDENRMCYYFRAIYMHLYFSDKRFIRGQLADKCQEIYNVNHMRIK